jgi:hypothetical protein
VAGLKPWERPPEEVEVEVGWTQEHVWRQRGLLRRLRLVGPQSTSGDIARPPEEVEVEVGWAPEHAW